jgi:hypothetical protein
MPNLTYTDVKFDVTDVKFDVADVKFDIADAKFEVFQLSSTLSGFKTLTELEKIS